MSAPERIPPRSVTTAELLARGELAVRGQVRAASNAVLHCPVSYEGWAGEPLTEEALDVLKGLRDALSGQLATRLATLITPAELDATRARVDALLDSGKHPEPSGEWPAIPWPPV